VASGWRVVSAAPGATFFTVVMSPGIGMSRLLTFARRCTPGTRPLSDCGVPWHIGGTPINSPFPEIHVSFPRLQLLDGRRLFAVVLSHEPMRRQFDSLRLISLIYTVPSGLPLLWAAWSALDEQPRVSVSF
jgi:hypothetical protein